MFPALLFVGAAIYVVRQNKNQEKASTLKNRSFAAAAVTDVLKSNWELESITFRACTLYASPEF